MDTQERDAQVNDNMTGRGSVIPLPLLYRVAFGVRPDAFPAVLSTPPGIGPGDVGLPFSDDAETPPGREMTRSYTARGGAS